MHDPLTLVGTIPGPWLRRDFKRRWRLGRMIDIWHRDPSGYDSETCRGKRWRWHIYHWRLRFLPYRNLRRRFSCCEWCGQRYRKGDPVNVNGGNGPRTAWYRRERGLYHSGCYSVKRAHASCTCNPLTGGLWPFGGGTWGDCGTCRKFRPVGDSDSPRRLTDAMFSTIPRGERPTKEQLDLSARLWREFRAEEGQR